MVDQSPSETSNTNSSGSRGGPEGVTRDEIALSRGRSSVERNVRFAIRVVDFAVALLDKLFALNSGFGSLGETPVAIVVLSKDRGGSFESERSDPMVPRKRGTSSDRSTPFADGDGAIAPPQRSQNA